MNPKRINWAGELVFLKSLGLKLLILLGLYALFRILFLLMNLDLFSGISFLHFLKIMAAGIRFDLVAILYLNIPVVLMMALPLPFRGRKWYRIMVKTFFYLVNIPAIVLAMIDMEYYRFSLKRTTVEVIGMLFDFMQLLPQFLKEYWYVLIAFAGLVFLVEWLYRKTETTTGEGRYWPVQVGLFVIVAGLTLLGARGGWQAKPVTPIVAADYTAPRYVPLVTNTPFNFLISLDRKQMTPYRYFESDVARKWYDIHEPIPRQARGIIPLDTARTDNIMLIVMESFSKEYMGLFGANPTATPFLDSLAEHSFVFEEAYANGFRSVDGIPAIIASIPYLMDEYFINSNYQTNRINGLGAVLEDIGYETAFFHGGNEGTFHFESFANLAGFRNYHGRSEYNDDTDFDGNWGIFDKPFFQYTLQEVNRMQPPFGAVLFSLSSHHPFTLPQGYEGRARHLDEPVLKTVHYADDALRQFFKNAAKQPWYDNTLFILLADHQGPPVGKVENWTIQKYGIPMIVHKPGSGLEGKIRYPVQQTDVLPGILDYLHTGQGISAFGKSLFRETVPRYCFQYSSPVFQIFDEQYLLQFDGTAPIGLFAYKSDTGLKDNLMHELPEATHRLEQVIKAVIQQYQQGMVKNELTQYGR